MSQTALVDATTSGPAPDPAAELRLVREETRFEISLLHDRVNALVTAEAFLTIAYTAAMSNAASWGPTFAAVAAPVLSVLGLLLAVLAWPSAAATAGNVATWTRRQAELLDAQPALGATVWGQAVRGRGRLSPRADQARSLLFFRAVPGLFVLVWSVLTVLALVLTRR